VTAGQPLRLVVAIGLDSEGRPLGTIGEGDAAVSFRGWLDLMSQLGRLARGATTQDR
jgi:hypothetical protein